MAVNLNDNLKRLEIAEAEVLSLLKQAKELTENINIEGNDEETNDPELAGVLNENKKLKYRLNILKKAVDNIKSNKMDEPLTKSSTPVGYTSANNSSFHSIQSTLNSIFKDAIMKAFPELPDPPVLIVPTNNPKFGDYQCNSAMAIAKILKYDKSKYREIAQKIVQAVSPHPLIEKLNEVLFINITLSRAEGQRMLQKILKHGVLPPPLQKKCRVVVDFSSPNIAKEMHVGHLRSTIIGDSICRLLEFLGHDVVRVNHIGDWGTQFGMLIAHLQDKFPDYLTKSPPIQDLQAFYKESKKRFDEDEEFKKRAYDCVVKLQSHQPDYLKGWNLICDVSRKEFQKIYDRLNIKITEKGESFYQSRMESLVKELDERGFLEEDEGRKIMWGDPNKIPFTLVKSDGGFTYDTSDMATIKYRIEEEHADWIIYVTDAGQATHFDVLQDCAKKCGILNPEKVRIDFVGFGVVLGEDKKKFKTRSGDTVRLIDLLDEGLKRSLNKLELKQTHLHVSPEELKEIQESIAYGCIKYADLLHNRNHEYIFSFDKMLYDKGNTAVYLMYVYTRIKSIARNAEVSPQQLKEAIDTVPISLEHEREWNLGKILLKFPDVLLTITKDLCLHTLCEYIYDISTVFNEFYDVCYCVERDSSGKVTKINMGRLLLCEVTALVMEKCFYILGLKPVSRM